MWLVKALVALGIAYVAVVAAMYLAQTWLIFPTFMVSAERPPLPEGAARLVVATPDGERLHGVRLPPARGAGEGKAEGQEADKGVVLGFGGNGWHADGLALDLRRHFPDREIVAFDYRGYRPSSGSPSAAALLADAVVIHDHVQQTNGPARVLAVGYSLGSGVASYLARERPLAGLILVTPFDALEAVAQQRYPWAPVRWLIRHRMPAAEFLNGVPVPTAVIAAERDVVVPPARTAALRRAVGDLVLDRTIAGTQHHDIFHHPDFRAAMAAATTEIDRRAPAGPR